MKDREGQESEGKWCGDLGQFSENKMPNIVLKLYKFRHVIVSRFERDA